MAPDTNGYNEDEGSDETVDMVLTAEQEVSQDQPLEDTMPVWTGDEDKQDPPAYRILFEQEDNLSKITETPTRMILPMVRMAIINAASDHERKESLIQTFMTEFDRRMISKERKGRLEAVDLMKAENRKDEDEDDDLDIL